MNKFIPANRPDLSGRGRKYFLEYFDTGWVSSAGPFVEQFESKMSRRRVGHSVVLS